jgi:nucleoid-associated protein YgaU
MRTEKQVLMVALAALVLFAAAGPLFAQAVSIMDIPTYRKALEFQRLSKDAFNTGEYEKAADYARQAEELSKQAVVEAERIRLSWVAYNLRNRADESLKSGQKRGWDTTWPVEFAEARVLFALASESFQRDEFEKSIEASRRILRMFEQAEAEWMLAMKKPGAQTADGMGGRTLPAFYVVRLVENARDCFWRIAGYDFIYGDPRKWPLLYEANKQLLQEPNNPGLIQPGMKFAIPSIAGEKREGVREE